MVEGGRLVGAITRKGALRSTLVHPALDADGRLRVAVAIGITGDAAAKAEAVVRPRCRPDRGRHRARPPGPDDRGGARGAQGRARHRRRGRQRGDRSRDRGADRGRRRHREGGRRPRGDVHHADDDRGRSTPVQRGGGVRPGRPQPRAPRVGRRRRAPPTRRRAGPGGRGVERDDRLVVRRHLRERGRRAARRRRRALQGELRHGLQQGGAPAGPPRVGLRPRPQGALRRGHQHVADVHRPRAARRGGHARPDRGRRPQRLHLHRRADGRRAARAGAVVGVQSAAGFEEGRPLPSTW